MKIGDYLIARKCATQPIKCGDGIVGSLEIKKGDKFFISDINYELNQIEIIYGNQKVWFSTSKKDESYFTEDYHIYFYDIIFSQRKEKLEKLNTKQNGKKEKTL